MSIVTQVRGRVVSQGLVAVCTLAALVVPRAGRASTRAAEVGCTGEAAHRHTRAIAQRPRRAVSVRNTRVAGAAPIASAPPRGALPPGRAGMIIEVDAPNGGAGPVATDPIQAIRADLDPALSRSTEGLEVLTFPDGSQRVNLQGRFRSYSVVTIGADGSLNSGCADDPAAALRLARAVGTSTPTARASRRAVGPWEE